MADVVGDAALVVAAREGDETAFGRLFDGWFQRVHDLALRVVHDPDAAADVTQDTFLAAWRNLASLERPESFGGWLLRIARNRAFDHLDKARRATPVDDETLAVMETRAEGPRVEERVAAAADPQRAVEEAEAGELVWEAASALGARDASVLDLHLRHGLAAPEIAEVLGVTPNNAHQLMFRLRNRLGDAIRARVLWRGGHPACDALTAALRERGVVSFGAAAVAIVAARVEGCDDCRDRQRLRLEPSVLFAALPLAVAPSMLRAKVAAALEAAGAPMRGSGASGAGGAGDDGGGADGSGDGADSGVGGDGGAGAHEAGGRRRRVRRSVVLTTVAAVVAGGVAGLVAVAGDGGRVAEPAAVGAAAAPTHSCPGGPLVGELAAGADVVASARDESGGWIELHSPEDPDRRVWVDARLVDLAGGAGRLPVRGCDGADGSDRSGDLAAGSTPVVVATSAAGDGGADDRDPSGSGSPTASAPSPTGPEAPAESGADATTAPTGADATTTPTDDATTTPTDDGPATTATGTPGPSSGPGVTDSTDGAGPSVTEITADPEEVWESVAGVCVSSPKTTVVEVGVSDPSGVASVEVAWSANGASGSKAMSGSGGTYAATLGPFDDGTVESGVPHEPVDVALTVTATDTAGNETVATGSFVLHNCVFE